MRKPKINLKKKYLLLHEILEALRFAGMLIISTGSEEKGFVPLNEIWIKTSRMHFGTLTDFINNPEKYKRKDGTIVQLNTIITFKQKPYPVYITIEKCTT